MAGLSMALPNGVSNAAALREMSQGGCNLVRVIPSSRWDVELVAHLVRNYPREVQSRVRHGAFLIDAELFEQGFFRISAAEASAMDPQQRQLLERGYVALHDAGMSKASLLGSGVAANSAPSRAVLCSPVLAPLARRSFVRAA